MILTNKHRDELIKACIAATFAKQEKAYAESRVKLADALYAQTYGAHEKDANKLPDGWLETTGHMRIECTGFKHQGDSGCNGVLALTKWRRIPVYSSRVTVKVTPSDPLHDQADALLDEYKKLTDAKAELEATLRGIVYACTTRAKLLEAWPEGVKFFPKEVPKQTTALVPRDLAEKANKLMGLKK